MLTDTPGGRQGADERAVGRAEEDALARHDQAPGDEVPQEVGEQREHALAGSVGHWTSLTTCANGSAFSNAVMVQLDE